MNPVDSRFRDGQIIHEGITDTAGNGGIDLFGRRFADADPFEDEGPVKGAGQMEYDLVLLFRTTQQKQDSSYGEESFHVNMKIGKNQ